jgi:putative membrane protein
MTFRDSFLKAALAFGLVTSVGLAQSTGSTGAEREKTKPTADPSSAPQPTAAPQAKTPQAATSGHVAGAAGESMIGPSDQQFLNKAAQSGMMEVQLGQMAQEKASSEEVKSYARKLAEEHQKANEQLKKIAEQRGVSLPSDMGPHQQHMAKLQNLSGAEFDKAFMKMQVQHHKKDIKEFQKQADRGMDTSLKDFATAQIPVLQQHLQQAEQLSRSTGTRGRVADAAADTTAPRSTDTKPKGQDNPTTQK